MFINCSNHKSELWSGPQREAAAKWGEIVDVPFPDVNPHASQKDISSLARGVVADILAKTPEVVMCQGEFTLTFTIVTMLQAAGICVVAACSEREVIESRNEDGSTEKKAIFKFVQFREYLSSDDSNNESNL